MENMEKLMDRVVGYLAKAVAILAAIATGLAVVIVVHTRTVISLPLLALASVAGVYAARVWAREARRSTATSQSQGVLIAS